MAAELSQEEFLRLGRCPFFRGADASLYAAGDRSAWRGLSRRPRPERRSISPTGSGAVWGSFSPDRRG